MTKPTKPELDGFDLSKVQIEYTGAAGEALQSIADPQKYTVIYGPEPKQEYTLVFGTEDAPIYQSKCTIEADFTRADGVRVVILQDVNTRRFFEVVMDTPE